MSFGEYNKKKVKIKKYNYTIKYKRANKYAHPICL